MRRPLRFLQDLADQIKQMEKLGGMSGMMGMMPGVNKIKQQSHDLSDGDLVELGEVRLRFRTNAEAAG